MLLDDLYLRIFFGGKAEGGYYFMNVYFYYYYLPIAVIDFCIGAQVANGNILCFLTTFNILTRLVISISYEHYYYTL